MNFDCKQVYEIINAVFCTSFYHHHQCSMKYSVYTRNDSNNNKYIEHVNTSVRLAHNSIKFPPLMINFVQTNTTTHGKPRSINCIIPIMKNLVSLQFSRARTVVRVNHISFYSKINQNYIRRGHTETCIVLLFHIN